MNRKLLNVNVEMSLEDVISILESYRQETGETWVSLAGQMNVNASALSAAKSGKYLGDIAALKSKIVDFLVFHGKQQAKKFELGFAETSQIRRVISTLRECHEESEMGAIWGPAGVGKSTGLRYFQEKYKSQVHIVTAYEGITPVDLMEEFLALFNIEMVGLENRKMKALIDYIKGKPWLLVIDEAHYLKARLIEKMRYVYDQSKVGLVFCGNDTVISQMQGRAKVYFSHVFSRIPNRCNVDVMPTKKDIEALCATTGMEFTKEVIAWLVKYAQAEGHYRYLSYLLQKAYKAASEKGDNVLTIDHLVLVNKVHYGVKE